MTNVVDPMAVLHSDPTSLASRSLSQAILRPTLPEGAPAAKIRIGEVTAFDTATWTATLNLSGSTTAVASIQSLTNYALSAGATVLVLQFGGSYVIAGEIGVADTGWLSSGLTDQSGYSSSGTEYRVVGNRWEEVRFDFTRTGGAQTFSANSGNITDIDITQLPTGYRPATTLYAAGLYGGGGAFFKLASNGMLTLGAVVPDKRDANDLSIANGSTGSVNFSFMR